MNSMSSLSSYSTKVAGVSLQQTYSTSNFASSLQNTASNFAKGTTTSQILTIGTGVFTIEFWVNPTANSSTQGIFGFSTTGSATNRMTCFLDYPGRGNQIYSEANSGGGTQTVSTNPSTISDGVWTHIAITRNSSGTVTIYVNGTVTGTPSTGWSSINFANFPSNTTLFRPYADTAQESFTGLITGFAVSKYLWYTGNFTPVRKPLNNDSTKLLLLNGTISGGNVVDSSSYNTSLTNTGLVTSATVPT